MSDIPWGWRIAAFVAGALPVLVIWLFAWRRHRRIQRELREYLDYWLTDNADEIDRHAEYFRLWEAKRHAECVAALDRVIARERARVERERDAQRET
jgi:hypothetical protein